ncbi:hypothetical protein GJ744_012343 [Endocarpon pusillum]|uniref:Uncharacterized protein n=1 Tax=Endocarpon pusillum TaxID=364733 RepID=A0A8H7AF56_9EURO|nr:hypothetical protein GJ744_012343 [Endocarpon pusillum]
MGCEKAPKFGCLGHGMKSWIRNAVIVGDWAVTTILSGSVWLKALVRHEVKAGASLFGQRTSYYTDDAVVTAAVYAAQQARQVSSISLSIVNARSTDIVVAFCCSARNTPMSFEIAKEQLQLYFFGSLDSWDPDQSTSSNGKKSAQPEGLSIERLLLVRGMGKLLP